MTPESCLGSESGGGGKVLPGQTTKLCRKASAVPRADFRALFCEFHRCPIQEYERQLLARCLHPHARPFAGILSRLGKDFFREDIGLIGDLATAVSHGEVLTELNRFYGRNVRDRNWLRTAFALRISGKRVLRLSRALFRRR